MKTKHWAFILIALLVFAPFSTWIDLSISNVFYRDGFYLQDYPFFTFFHQYGEWPALIVGGLALISFTCSFILSSFRSTRQISLYLVLVLVVGALLLVNSTLKNHWGRPRPKQTENYGGNTPFRPFYSPDFHHNSHKAHDNHKSFPSGHAAMGFYFYALVVIGRKRRQKALFFSGIALTLLLGGALSLTRIAQGGHYFSDTLFSALIMIATAEGLSYLIPIPKQDKP